MKKKDIRYRKCLVIKLLSLMSLSSCVQTNSRLVLNANADTHAQEREATRLENSTSQEPVIDNISDHEQEASSSQRASSFYSVIRDVSSTGQRFGRRIRAFGALVVREVQANQYIAEGVVVGAAVGHLISAPINNYLNERLGYTNVYPRESLSFYPEL